MSVNTPTAIEHLIERLAEDKAYRLRTLAKATVVMMAIPEWVRAEEAYALFGMPLNQLIERARTGEIIARKTDPYLRASATIFKTESIRAAIERMMPYDKWANERPDLAAEGAAGAGEAETEGVKA